MPTIFCAMTFIFHLILLHPKIVISNYNHGHNCIAIGLPYYYGLAYLCLLQLVGGMQCFELL
jgi:hypothetical protein